MALKFLAFQFLGREPTLAFQPRRLFRPNTCVCGSRSKTASLGLFNLRR
jgi:hypothetical protein